MYDGDMIAAYEETEEKKQQLWDTVINWCKKYNAATAESWQNDDFQIEAPSLMVDVIDEIIQFKTQWVDSEIS